MEIEQTITVLNSLITINNDRIKGYETASKETDEQDLKTLFVEFSSTSQKCKNELVTEVTKLGGEPAEGTMMSGKFFRVWMDVKSALTGKDRKTILSSCEYGEDVAQETYEKVLDNEAEKLNAEQHTMLMAQKSLLKADHDKVKSMRDLVMAD